MIYGETITRLRAPTTTEYGAPVRDWGNAVESSIAGVQVQPVSSEEDARLGRAPVVTHMRIISKPGTGLDLLRSDRVRWNGVTWLVDGEVAVHKSPRTGGVHHGEVLLRRVDG